jgi:peroxiredoxin
MIKLMKTTFALVPALILAMAAQAIEVGKPAPDFTATDINGKTIKLSDYKGKVVVIESYNSDCPFCNNQYKTGAMQELQSDLEGKGVVWLLVNSVNPNNRSHRTPEQAKQEMTNKKIVASAWIDDSSGAVGRLYGMKTTPEMYVIDKNGTLVYAGAIDDKPDPSHNPKTARNYVREAVDALMAGKPIEVSQTKPYGCSVKYAD